MLDDIYLEDSTQVAKEEKLQHGQPRLLLDGNTDQAYLFPNTIERATEVSR